MRSFWIEAAWLAFAIVAALACVVAGYVAGMRDARRAEQHDDEEQG